MDNTKILVLDREKAVTMIRFIALVGVASVVPLFHYQPITGPVVNATLFIATMLLGAQMGVLVGLIPSVIALSTGLLPAVLAPMVPFIMISNAIMVVAFDMLKKKNYWLGVVVGSVLKFLFLFGTSFVVINLLLKKEIAAQVSAMMSWPQLFTALVGGMLAFVVVRYFKK